MAKILIVEDDILIARMYQKIFESEGNKVFIAQDGQAGLDMARTLLPTVILLDIMMPKLNGMQMLEELERDPKISGIPVVVLTNLSGTNDAERALSLGAIKYIVKSEHKPKEVYEIVKEILIGYTRNDIPLI